ncbi:MAG TPA: glycosyltransferase family 39 protein [Pyrinomonadaceae bacterium]|nr:glycosyltransferase family 39 protein [Pyrinomonadaceae bacterium]
MIENRENEQVENARPMDWVWFLSCAAITALAIFLRFFALEIKPLHHDEGVNGHFLTALFQEGVYRYDPGNYHGPTLYYLTLPFTKLFGLETLPVRWSVAVWGVLIVVLAFYLRRYIGRIGSLFAALFLAISPGMVYFSRYYIHEIFFVFLALGLVLAVAFFLEQKKPGVGAIIWIALLLLACFFPSTLNLSSAIAKENETLFWVISIGIFLIEAALVFLIIRMLLGWNDGRPIYLLLASACISLMFATKETAFITLGTMLIACICLWIWPRIYSAAKDLNGEFHSDDLSWTNFRTALGTGTDRILMLVGAAAIFIYVGVLFFSSFFTYPEGVGKAFEAYAIWTKTGSKDHTQNGTWAYLKWGMEIEGPIMILSVVGTAIAFFRPRSRFAMFTGLWAFGLFAAYSLIPYKTPWLALSFLLPMCIIGGFAINEFASFKQPAAKAVAVIATIAACAVLSYQTYILNFVRYDDEDMPYVYAHTKREFLDLVSEINRYSEKSGKGQNAKIQVVSPEYWPLVWYLKDNPQALFHGRTAPADKAEMIIAKKGDQDSDVARRYSTEYEYVGTYGLRPGVDLVLLVRKDLSDKH